MEMHWGDFSLLIDKTNMTLLLAIPILIIMQLPTLQRLVKWVAKKVSARKARGNLMIDYIKGK